MKNYILLILSLLIHTCCGTGVFAQTGNPNTQSIFEYLQSGNNFVKNPFARQNTNSVSCTSSPLATKNRVTGTTKFKGIAAHTIITPGGVGAYCEPTINTPTQPHNDPNFYCDAEIFYSGLVAGGYGMVVTPSGGGATTVPMRNTASGEITSVYLTLPCAATAPTIRMQRIVAGVDSPVEYAVYYGPTRRLGKVQDSAYLFGSAEQLGNSSGCQYGETTSSGLTNWVDLGTGTSCNAWTVTGKITTVGTNDHRITLPSMPAGDYKIEVIGTYQSNTAAQICAFRLSDGTNSYQNTWIYSQSGTIATPTGSFQVSNTTARTNVTYKIQAADNGAGLCALDNANLGANLAWKVWYYPPAASANAVTVDQQQWNVDAVITGTYTLSNSGSYTTMTNASASLVNSPTSNRIDAKIACAGTTVATGLTCSGVDESNGITFDMPREQYVKACVYFGAGYATASSGTLLFRIAETANNAQTSIQDGATVTNAGGNYANTSYTPHTNCSTLKLGQGTKTLRLFYATSNAAAATVSPNSTLRWTVEPIENVPNGVVKIDPPVYIPFEITTVGANTLTVPQGASIEIDTIVGGGGGGAGSGAAAGTAPGDGGATTFGSLVSAAGGLKGNFAGAGGLGGAGVTFTGVSGISIQGSPGSTGTGSQSSPYLAGGAGGNSCLGGAGTSAVSALVQPASPNTGSGGAGGATGSAAATAPSGGGGAGACGKNIRIANPASSYTVTIGAGGTAGGVGTGTGVVPGGAGAAGRVFGRFVFSSWEAMLASGNLQRIPGSFTSNLTDRFRTHSVNVKGSGANNTCTGTCTLVANDGVTSVSRSTTATYVVTLDTTYTGEFVCNVNALGNNHLNGPAFPYINVSGVLTNPFTVYCINNAGTAVDCSLAVSCKVPRP